MLKIHLLFLFMVLGFTIVTAQPLVKVTGVITDQLQSPLPKVTISVLGQNISTVSDENGVYNIYSVSTSFTIKYNLLGYNPILVEVKRDKEGRITQNVSMTSNINELEQVTITTRQNQLSNTTVLNITDIASMPSASGNFEVILKTLPGVSTNNELSFLMSR